MKNYLKWVSAVTLIVLMTACSNVKSWERDHLAQKAMLPDGYQIDQSVDDHIYYSKEASTGGNGFGGGGCGCN